MNKKEFDSNYSANRESRLNFLSNDEEKNGLRLILIAFISVISALGLFALFVLSFQPQIGKLTKTEKKSQTINPKQNTTVELTSRRSCGIYPINAKSKAEAEFKVMWKYLDSKCEIEKTIEKDGYFDVYTYYKQ